MFIFTKNTGKRALEFNWATYIKETKQKKGPRQDVLFSLRVRYLVRQKQKATNKSLHIPLIIDWHSASSALFYSTVWNHLEQSYVFSHCWAFRDFPDQPFTVLICLFSVFIRFHFWISHCTWVDISRLFFPLHIWFCFMISRPLRSLVFPRCLLCLLLPCSLSPTVGICGPDSHDCRHVQTGDVQINNSLILLESSSR